MLNFQADHSNKRVYAHLDASDDNTRRGIRQFWFALGKALLKSFNAAVLAKPRAGRVYRSKRGRKHVASLPGESPANRTGNYRKAAGFQIRGAMEMQFGDSAEYAGFLENGTSRMRARPGLGNAVSSVEGESIATASALIERELTRI